MKFAYWMLATIGIQVLVGLGLALCLGDISPAHATSTAIERRIYSAVDTGAFYVAMSSPALIFSAAIGILIF